MRLLCGWSSLPRGHRRQKCRREKPCRNSAWRRSFAGLERVGFLFIEHEAAETVFIAMPVSPAMNTRSERREHALDQRDNVAVAVGGAKIGRIAAGRGSAHRRCRRLLDRASLCARHALWRSSTQSANRRARVVEVGKPVRKGDLLGLDHRVDRVRRRHRRQREALGDVSASPKP